MEAAITEIRVFVEGADGLHGRPYMPDHAIDVLLEIVWERQRQVDLHGHSRKADDELGAVAMVDKIYKIAAAAEFDLEQFQDRDEMLRRSLISMAALAWAANEAIDRRTGNARPDDPIAGDAPLAGMCDCIDKVNELLKPRNGQLDLMFIVDRDSGAVRDVPCIQTMKLNLRGRVKPPSMAPTFCPFCGQRYQPETPAADAAVEPAHG
ncbi:hypothetical protein [Inquilinus sp. CA228]|uniref:hypothetical protein n=1 Tax=Inquilinus sp. CA228 TaxID=3455609 RepID=UPI003F8D4ED1